MMMIFDPQAHLPHLLLGADGRCEEAIGLCLEGIESCAKRIFHGKHGA